jgi:hypothetical protein
MRAETAATVLITAIVMLASGYAYAHQPTSVELSYDLKNKSLSVRVGYYTEDRSYNHIKQIEIKVNGKAVQSYHYTYQAFTTGTGTRSYKVEAKPGDVIEVTATSTTNESKTERLKVVGDR